MKLNNFKKIFQKKINKKWMFIILVFVIVVVIGVQFINIQPVYAVEPPVAEKKSWLEKGATVAFNLLTAPITLPIGALLAILIWLVGQISILFIWILFAVAEYSGFIKEPIVTQGWVAVRDVCNMFFVLILLIIAFTTILRIESYNIKKILPKVLIIAVLINFSKTICGIFIDFTQVIMLTFINTFNVGGNFIGHGILVNALGLDKFFNFKEYGRDVLQAITGESLTIGTIATMILGLLLLIIALCVIAIYTIILIFRIIMLWILVVLSPLAFLAMSIPVGAKYASQWTDEFTKYVIIGPIMAFFLWLALTLGNTPIDISSNKKFESGSGSATKIEFDSNLLSDIGGSENMINFIVIICFLLGGLMMAQQMGVAGGSMAGDFVGKVKSMGTGAAMLPVRLGKRIGGWGVDKASELVGVDLNPVRMYKRVVAQMDKHKRDKELKIREKTAEIADTGGGIRGRLAYISTGDVLWQNVTNWRQGGLKSFLKSGKVRTREEKKLDKDREALITQRKGVWTTTEKADKEKEIENWMLESKRIDEEIVAQNTIIKSPSSSSAQKTAATEKLEKLREDKIDHENKVEALQNALETTPVDDAAANKIDAQIKQNEKDREELKAYEIKGIRESRAEAQAELRAEQGKTIAHIDNAGELGEILKDAIKNGEQGLVSVIATKMTRNGDYNEMMKVLGLGTGHKGMLELGRKLQKSGFTEQAALGLIGEIGNIAKGINHFGAFGAVTMENGKWRESKEDEYEATMLAEMLKVNPQEFARKTNRLGIGFYKDGDHSINNWEMSKAAIAYMKLNASALAEQYRSTGQQNALEHMYKALDDLKKNHVSDDLQVTIIQRALGKGADAEATIRSIKK